MSNIRNHAALLVTLAMLGIAVDATGDVVVPDEPQEPEADAEEQRGEGGE